MDHPWRVADELKVRRMLLCVKAVGDLLSMN